ncbi:MAG: cation transporter, partial [Fusobacteriaceae bacterium]
MKKNTFRIEGMNCSSCSGHVEKAVRKLDGIVEANVNLAAEKLVVEFHEKKLSVNEIINAVQNAGYKATLEEEFDLSKNDDKKVSEIKELLNRFIASLVFTIPLLAISMGHMVGYSLPDFISPELSPKTFSLAQLFLTTPVLLLG